jgi:virginiamycin B lyase
MPSKAKVNAILFTAPLPDEPSRNRICQHTPARLRHTCTVSRRISKFLIPAIVFCGLSSAVAAAPRSIAELAPVATIKLGKTADWVAVTLDAVWVGSTGPFAVHRIDPKTNSLAASVAIPGAPCSGLAMGSGSLWVPMCTSPPSLGRVDLKTNRLLSVHAVGPAAAESGVAFGAGSVWIIVNKSGDLVQVEPDSGRILNTYKTPAGSYNPIFSDGTIWVSHAEGADLTGIDAVTGKTTATIATGPNPRFLTVGAGAIWTLNQGDGSVTRADARTRKTSRIVLDTPGHGGDIAFGAGMIWTTMPKMPLSVIDARTGNLGCQWAGPGGDSLGVGHGAIWLTDYDGGSVSRIPIEEALSHCRSS